MLVDSHCHLDYLARDGDLDAALARARDGGIGTMLTIGTTLGDFDSVHAIAKAHDDIWCSVGVHPHDADEEGDVDAARLVELSKAAEVVGIGETGLDYYYENSAREAQKASFRTHIAAARESGLPLIVHTREADADTIDILRDEYANGPFTGVIHCFSTGRQVADAALEIGFYISFSGILTFKKAQELRDIAADIPMDRLLVETDSPYLAPVPMRGKRNEPAYTAHTAAQLAEIRDIPLDEVEKITTDNFFRLFAKADRPA